MVNHRITIGGTVVSEFKASNAMEAWLGYIQNNSGWECVSQRRDFVQMKKAGVLAVRERVE
jgi:hypothetical protein